MLSDALARDGKPKAFSSAARAWDYVDRFYPGDEEMLVYEMHEQGGSISFNAVERPR